VSASPDGIASLPRRALAAFVIYFGVTLSKRYWFPLLDDTYFWLADVLCFVGLPVALWVGFRLPRKPAFALGAKRPQALTQGEVVYLVLLLLLGLWLASNVGINMGNRLARHFPDVLPRAIDYVGHVPSDGVARWVVAVYVAVSAGVIEEYFFRGLLGVVCAHYLGRSVAVFVVVSVLAFAAIHWGGGLVNVIAAGCSGVLLAAVYARTGDLRIPMAAHTLIWARWLV